MRSVNACILSSSSPNVERTSASLSDCSPVSFVYEHLPRSSSVFAATKHARAASLQLPHWASIAATSLPPIALAVSAHEVVGAALDGEALGVALAPQAASASTASSLVMRARLLY